MIKERTVLILGAGTSYSYGLPLGSELKNLIVRNLERSRAPNPKNPNRVELLNLDFDHRLINEFQAALDNSDSLSIDEFLSYRKEFSALGKVAIVQCLNHLEKREKFNNEKMHWYKYLWQHIKDGIDQHGNNHNKLSIITFNYDRSLEYYLWRCIKYTFDYSDNIICKIIDNFSIHHVYGKIADLPFQNPNNNKPYTSELGTYDNLRDLSKNIKLIQELSFNQYEHDPLNDILFPAKNIYFMGFGYHEMNIKLLKGGIGDHLRSHREPPKIIGAAKNKTGLEIKKINESFIKHGILGVEIIEDKYSDNLAFLRNIIRLD